MYSGTPLYLSYKGHPWFRTLLSAYCIQRCVHNYPYSGDTSHDDKKDTWACPRPPESVQNRTCYCTVHTHCYSVHYCLFHPLPDSPQWSFGVVCWEVFNLGRIPYHGVDTLELPQFLKKGGRLQQPMLSPQPMWAIKRNCGMGRCVRITSLLQLSLSLSSSPLLLLWKVWADAEVLGVLSSEENRHTNFTQDNERRVPAVPPTKCLTHMRAHMYRHTHVSTHCLWLPVFDYYWCWK